MKGLPILFLLLIAGYASKAQSDFREGYLITSTSDTIRGLLNKGLMENNSDYIQFKSGQNAEAKEYTPNQIYAYQFQDDALYISRKIWNKDLYMGKVFMEALVIGPASVYAYKGDFFVTKDDSTEVVLKRVEKKTGAAGREIVVIEYKGVGALNYLLSDCSLLNKDLQTKRISEKIITRHIVEYNECKGSPYTEPKKNRQWSTINFGIGAGFYASKLWFSQNATNFPYLRNGNYNSYGPSVMASAFLSSPRLNDKLSFRMDLMYSYFNYATYVVKTWGYQGSGPKDGNKVEIKLHTLSFPISVQYVLKESTLSPYLNFGGSFNYHISASNKLIKEQTIGDQLTKTESDAFHKSNTQLGLWLGFGINKKLSQKVPGFIELRLEGTNGVLRQSYASWRALTSNQGTAYLMTGIKF